MMKGYTFGGSNSVIFIFTHSKGVNFYREEFATL